MQLASIRNVYQSIGKFLKSNFPEVPVYFNPNQQDTKLPAFFITFITDSTIKDNRVYNDRRYQRTFKIDLTYANQYNLPNLYEEYYEVADFLDTNFRFLDFIYIDDTTGEEKTQPIKIWNAKWHPALDALHYKFDLKLDVYLPDVDDEEAPYMQTLDVDIIVKEYIEFDR